MQRKHKEKFNCVYCGKLTATFCGYWKMISVANYLPDNKKDKTTYIDSCYAHIGCYLKKYEKIITCGVIPLCVHNAVYDRPKQIVEMMKLHNSKPQHLRNTIKFLQRVIDEYESSQLKPSKKARSHNSRFKKDGKIHKK